MLAEITVAITIVSTLTCRRHNMRHDADITNDNTLLRLTVPEAAEVLGISAEAVRQLFINGTATTEKEDDGSVFVLLDADSTRHNADRSVDRSSDRTGDLSLMQAHL